MRCLALARVLRDKGANCVFVMRAYEGHLRDTVNKAGFICHLLPGPHALDAVSIEQRAMDWLAADWCLDAEQTLAIPEIKAVSLIVVDNYSIDARWQRAVRGNGRRIMVIDDLANRVHDCDILLDQNIGRQRSDYDGLIPKTALRLIGPRCALLRPEFAATRQRSLVSRAMVQRPLKVVVALGGMDADNLTTQVLEVLSQDARSLLSNVTVVLGANAPGLTLVRAAANSMPVPTQLLVGTDRVADVLADADLAIGAGGISAIERCVLGLPSLLLVLADNQYQSVEAIASSGGAIKIGDVRTDEWRQKLRSAIHKLCDMDRLAEMSKRASALADGTGTSIVACAIFGKDFALRPADLEDAETVWEWRRANGAQRFYISERQPELSSHLTWFKVALASPENRLMLMVENLGHPVSHLRVDWIGDCARISIVVDPKIRNHGIGRKSLTLLEEFLSSIGTRTLLADVHMDNLASRQLFVRAGYSQIGQAHPFCTWQKII